MTVRVVLVDDQRLLRRGLRLILDSEPDLEVVAEAQDGADAIRAVRAHRPDVVLMDIQMPVLDGLAATQQILAGPEPVPKVVILTTFERDDYVFEALRSGASGFLLKTAPPEDLIDAVHAAARGDALLSPSVTRRVIEEVARRVPRSLEQPEYPTLTGREREVLALLARGRSNAEIARELYVAEATVKTHVSAVLTKLELRDRVQAVIHAYEHGLIRPGEPPPSGPGAVHQSGG